MCNSNETFERDGSFYMTTVKFIRDLVHGYVYLTKFDLELIDTPEFQRLKDVRQLTCQHVYPAARHTRFEHSLGVLELTRQAMKNLNRNGMITESMHFQQELFDKQLMFNASLAALLHDVGHCPFSHMGESEFDKGEVWQRLFDASNRCVKLANTSLLQEFEKINNTSNLRKPGAVHEQMSCIIILEKYYDKLSKANWKEENVGKENYYDVDFELIIRSILGMNYDTSTIELYNRNKKKNIVVNLINSPIFDMDKLDYIMRDSLLTGIGTPQIDTHRLFKNMYLNSEQDYTLVFTHRAEPVLQNMIEARDKLYMYVYNHHASVFSDFMYSYIFRRLAHNERAFQSIVKLSVTKKTIQELKDSYVGDSQLILDELISEQRISPRTHLGVVPKSYLFSTNAIIEQMRSDSDMISLLHDIYYLLSQYFELNEEIEGESISSLELYILGEIKNELIEFGISAHPNINKKDMDYMLENIQRIYVLIDKYQKREFLKPWWKTNFEFSDFINHNFRDDHVRQQLCTWICQGPKDMPAGDEFRSQIAKHVIYITKALYKQQTDKGVAWGLLETLDDGDFFVIERAARFYEPNAISKLDIALKNSEILGSPNQVKSQTKDFYIKELTNIIPQRDYYSMYPKESFYIFSKPLSEKKGTPNQRSRHYQLLEEIFVFVSTQLIKNGSLDFQEKFVNVSKEEAYGNEDRSRETLLHLFCELRGYVE